MKINFKQIALFIATVSIFVGCGNDAKDITNNTNMGYFIDSEVVGVNYETSSGLSGVTDSYGRFHYNIGDKIKFSLGQIVLGESQPNSDGLITPNLLIVGDNTLADENQTQTITLMLQTLQSMDIDNNPTNGITISSDVITQLNTLSTTISFKDINESYLIDLDHKLSLGLDDNNDSMLDVNESTATAHFENSLATWNQGERPDKYASGNGNGFDLTNYPLTENLSQDLKEALAYMGNEERLAHDVYINLYNYHLTTNNIDITQLFNIATNSETKHIEIVRSLVDRYSLTHDDVNVTNDVNASSSTDLELVSGQYNIPSIQTLYNTLYDLGNDSKIDALKVGCMVEVTDINDLDEYIKIAEDANATDVVEAFKFLRSGSYTHYWAFDQGLKNEGIINGCYFEGDTLLTDKSEIYPQNEPKNMDSNHGTKHGKRR